MCNDNLGAFGGLPEDVLLRVVGWLDRAALANLMAAAPALMKILSTSSWQVGLDGAALVEGLDGFGLGTRGGLAEAEASLRADVGLFCTKYRWCMLKVCPEWLACTHPLKEWMRRLLCTRPPVVSATLLDAMCNPYREERPIASVLRADPLLQPPAGVRLAYLPERPEALHVSLAFASSYGDDGMPFRFHPTQLMVYPCRPESVVDRMNAVHFDAATREFKFRTSKKKKKKRELSSHGARAIAWCVVRVRVEGCADEIDGGLNGPLRPRDHKYFHITVGYILLVPFNSLNQVQLQSPAARVSFS